VQGDAGNTPSMAPAAATPAPVVAPCNETFVEAALRLGLTFVAQALNGSGLAADVPHPSEGVTVFGPTNQAFIRMLALKGALPSCQRPACHGKQGAAVGHGLDPSMTGCARRYLNDCRDCWPQRKCSCGKLLMEF
jgi:hypothetical protein